MVSQLQHAELQNCERKNQKKRTAESLLVFSVHALSVEFLSEQKFNALAIRLHVLSLPFLVCEPFSIDSAVPLLLAEHLIRSLLQRAKYLEWRLFLHGVFQQKVRTTIKLT